MASYLWLCISLILFSSTYVFANEQCSVGPWEDLECSRIPNDTSATFYELYLHPDLVTKSFSGHVTIHIVATIARDFFVINIKNLTINYLNLTKIEASTQKTPVDISNACEYEPKEFFIIQTNSTIEPGNYELYLEFDGTLADKIVGFYYSTYKDEFGDDISLATTKFEPTYARQSFPCFDEPSFRSNYSVTIVRPSNNDYIGISNMPIEFETRDAPSANLTEVKFMTSVSMVTYLVCFIVSDFANLESTLNASNGDLLFRVYGPTERINNLQYALDFGSSTLLYYEQMFDYAFPLPKSDMAAIPDYSSGATEHWGIITYRETNIFYNNETSSETNYQQVSGVIAHEMAHQWFGNLVTLEWWNDLWLNEGFAAYVQYIGVNHYHPDWDMKAQFLIDKLQDVFDLDSKLSSHPIVNVVCTPDEITAIFDSITYDKGSSVIRMCEGFMGKEKFQAGINSFLNDYAFQNAVTQDLWDELQVAWNNSESNKSISEIMDTWTIQMGYPLVTVQQEPGHPSLIRLFQTRFLKNPNAESNSADSPFGYKWNIPLNVLTSSGNVVQRWFYTEVNEVLMDLGEDVEWVKVNYRQKGFYRVNYVDSITWGKLADLCANLNLSTEDRSSLYDDVFALGNSGILDYKITLDFSESLVNEIDYVPWYSASKNLEENIYLLLSAPNVTDPFSDYVQSLVSSIYRDVGWDSNEDFNTHLDSLLRYVIVDLACMSGINTCLVTSGNLYESWIQNESYPLPLDTKRKVYWWGQINSGSESNWNLTWDRCMAENDASQRNNLYYGLSNSQDVDILDNYITMSQDLDNVKQQDFLTILEYISLNPVGMDLVWDWVRANWDWLVSRYGLNDRYLGQLIPSITQYFATTAKLIEMEVFFRQNQPAGAGKQDREEALDTVIFNIYWVNNNAPVIKQWLNNNT